MNKGLNEIKRAFREHIKWNEYDGIHMSIHEFKMDFLCGLLGITGINDVCIGEDIIEVLNVICNGQHEEYVKDVNNAKKFIMIANILDCNCWIEKEEEEPFTEYHLSTEIMTDSLYSLDSLLLFENEQEVNNLISYLKSNEL